MNKSYDQESRAIPQIQESEVSPHIKIPQTNITPYITF